MLASGESTALAQVISAWDEAIRCLSERVRRFFYAVVLSVQACPDCEGSLTMVREGRCRCNRCGRSFDPTTAFQRCDTCGANLILARRRYRCCRCGYDTPSRFLYDGRVFDAEYFRTRMAESRERRHERRRSQTVERLLDRSAPICPEPMDLGDSPGLLAAIKQLTGSSGVQLRLEDPDVFDLAEYQRHVLAALAGDVVEFTAIPPTKQPGKGEVARLFIAVVFLWHLGRVTVEQHGGRILVMKRETHGEGQAVPGDAESADGLGGPLGGVEA